MMCSFSGFNFCNIKYVYKHWSMHHLNRLLLIVLSIHLKFSEQKPAFNFFQKVWSTKTETLWKSTQFKPHVYPFSESSAQYQLCKISYWRKLHMKFFIFLMDRKLNGLSVDHYLISMANLNPFYFNRPILTFNI